MNQEGYFGVVQLNAPGGEGHVPHTVAEAFARDDYFQRWLDAFGPNNGTQFIFPFHQLGTHCKGKSPEIFKHRLGSDYFVFYQIDDKFYGEVKRGDKTYLRCTDEAHMSDISIFVTSIMFDTEENYSKYL